MKMINTRIYEGHTKGDPEDNPDSWRVVGDGFVMNDKAPADRYIGYIKHSNFKPDTPAEIQPFSEADANLIADAPLLLAEVKRLRETVKAYLDLDMESLEFCRIMRDMGVIE